MDGRFSVFRAWGPVPPVRSVGFEFKGVACECCRLRFRVYRGESLLSFEIGFGLLRYNINAPEAGHRLGLPLSRARMSHFCSHACPAFGAMLRESEARLANPCLVIYTHA